MARETKFIIAAVLAVASLLAIILVPLSLQGVEYHQMAFKRRRTTGSVDTARVYTAGLYSIGPDAEFKAFPSIAHTEHFNKITVFTSDRLQVHITCTLQYFVRPHQLVLLHKNFDRHYESIMSSNALDAVKGAATQFSTDDFIWDRGTVEETIFLAVMNRLGGECCEKDCGDSCVAGCKPYESCDEGDLGLFVQVRYFQLGQVELPNNLNEQYIRALVLQEEAETEQNKQEAQLVRKETQKQVEEIDNQASEITQNATAQSVLIESVAQAQAYTLVEEARGTGLALLYTHLSITDQDQRAAFDYMRTLKNHKNAKITVEYQQNIAGEF